MGVGNAKDVRQSVQDPADVRVGTSLLAEVNATIVSAVVTAVVASIIASIIASIVSPFR